MHHKLLTSCSSNNKKEVATDNSPQINIRTELYWNVSYKRFQDKNINYQEAAGRTVNSTRMRNYWTCNSERYPKLAPLYTGTKRENYDACKAEGANLGRCKRDVLPSQSAVGIKARLYMRREIHRPRRDPAQGLISCGMYSLCRVRESFSNLFLSDNQREEEAEGFLVHKSPSPY